MSVSGDAVFSFTTNAIGDKLASAGRKKLSAVRESMAALQREEKRLLDGRKKVFIGMPGYSKSQTERDAWFALTHTASDNETLTTTCCQHCNSLLARGMNMLYAQAQYQGYDYFAMLHTDIGPEAGWVDKLWQVMEEHDADVVSAVSPIKSAEGLTSTAIDLSSGPEVRDWHVRRLTMQEVMKLPETFSQADTVEAGMNPGDRLLLVNTGCMLVNLRKPWVRKTNDFGDLLCYFTIQDGIQITDGRYDVRVIPEDWGFSKMVQETDPAAKVLATRAVRLRHWGDHGFDNNTAWGTLAEDNWQAGLPVPQQNIPAAEPADSKPATGTTGE